MNTSILTIIFRHGLDKLNDRSETIFKTKKEVVIHIRPRQRICELYTVNRAVAVNQSKDDTTIHMCAGELSPRHKNGQHIISYITDEDKDHVMVYLKKIVVQITRPMFDIIVSWHMLLAYTATMNTLYVRISLYISK